MNNPTIDNDLQKAIDDITKITDDDPIFADPVAAPAPAPMPAPAGVPAPQAPRMTAPTNMVPPMPAPKAPIAPAPAPAPEIKEEVVSAKEEIVTPKTPEPFMDASKEKLDKSQVKEAALRDLAPILGKLDIPSEKKFDIYKTVIDDYNDSSVIAPAYETATDIKDDKERAEALLYLIESIDKM